ncbi:MAG TPA: DNA mismatch repair protein MutS [Edaphobacter sp.]|uniref:DNA mismatch repair protein MutS n=1 Tax=Edaphobacter sp. TaxID=1934404 RepID=UPI002C638D32|nr:DNA mismatch repair protein MutS [Edaphobacter sp.]HUZ97173.1 DNA mismatch repair protein MutS [Edaphobacter sp.]
MTNEATSNLMGDTAALTPVMRQYFTAKEQYPDCLMFCRIGDFYELFYEDAITASRELQLTLTARDKEKKQPMCGVPYHAAEGYFQRLLRKGYRIAVCEQIEDPKLTKTIVRREVTRVLTPGTAVDPALGAEQSNYLASVVVLDKCVGLALLDLSTGEFRATEFSGADGWALAADELGRVRPVELLYAQGGLAGLAGDKQVLRFAKDDKVFRESTDDKVSRDRAGSNGDAKDHLPDAGRGTLGSKDEDSSAGLDAIRTKTSLEDWVFTADYAVPLLRNHLRVHSLDGMGLGGHETAAVAAGALLHYMRATKQGGLEHVDVLRFYERSTCLELDAVSVRNLELVEPLFSGESSQTTLFYTLDACCTPMGRRLLRSTLLRPSSELSEIKARLEAVGEATSDLRKREELRRSMNGVLDLERLLGRVALDSAGPREVMALAGTLGCLPGIVAVVNLFEAGLWRKLSGVAAAETHVPESEHGVPGFVAGSAFDAMEDLHEMIVRTIADEPPVSLADGGVIRAGVDAELDELRELSRSGRQALVAIEERERQRTGIGSLKVRFNSVFGYYLEVTKANAKAVPADYERKQTLVNAERFTTPELKEYETKILTAQERSGEIERRLFAELRRQLLDAAKRMRDTARRVAEIDMLGCFAHLAALRGWTRPDVDASGVLEFIGARHPVVERRLEESGGGRFVPNSVHLDADAGPAVLLITGPNMGGKSTYLRQAALLVVMAQCGCFVPAERMRVGLVDRIYTRIGASDNVARGRSTFMVEMTETAAILNTATNRSLVLLDEMGRGTATYDGLSLAWATVEHLHDRIGARTLFATHYHELTLLAERLARLTNLRVTVKETPSGIVFLHTVEAGAASKSYGIEVARLAGLPAVVISRAREVLKVHERAETQQVREAGSSTPQMQMTMFTPLSQKIVDRLGEVDVDGLTPREALNLLAELQRELKG